MQLQAFAAETTLNGTATVPPGVAVAEPAAADQAFPIYTPSKSVERDVGAVL